MEPEHPDSMQDERYFTLIRASQQGHCHVVTLCLERGTGVNTVTQMVTLHSCWQVRMVTVML